MVLGIHEFDMAEDVEEEQGGGLVYLDLQSGTPGVCQGIIVKLFVGSESLFEPHEAGGELHMYGRVSSSAHPEIDCAQNADESRCSDGEPSQILRSSDSGSRATQGRYRERCRVRDLVEPATMAVVPS